MPIGALVPDGIPDSTLAGWWFQDKAGPRLVPSLEAYRRMVHGGRHVPVQGQPTPLAGARDLATASPTASPARQTPPGCNRSQTDESTDVVIVGTGAHFPSFASSAKVRLYNETLDAVGEFLRDWKSRNPNLFVAWHGLPTLELGSVGTPKATKYGWYSFEAKNRFAHDRLVGVVDLFLDDRMPQPNPRDAVAKHDGTATSTSFWTNFHAFLTH